MLRLHVLAALAGACAGLERRSPSRAALSQVQSEAAMLREFHTVGQQLPMPTLTKGQPFTCDVDSSGPICLGSQERITLPAAKPPGLVGFWSFDEKQAVDHAGDNHAVTPFQPGPALGGRGQSAAFRRSYVTIPSSQQLQSQDFSYTFWLRFVTTGADDQEVIPETGLKLCPILRKGLENRYQQTYAAAPAILIDRETRKLRVEVATRGDGSSGAQGEAIESNARLREDQWFHIAVVRLDAQRRTRLYVNGVLDASAPTLGYGQPNDEPLFVGSDPVFSDRCDVPLLLDELRVYSRPLTPDEIQAEAAPALNGIEPSFVRLSCISCPLETAMQNCPEGYHICNALELHMGGYQVARTLGWLKPSDHVWSHATPSNAALQHAQALGMGAAPAPTPGQAAESGLMGLGLCCSDS